MEADVDLSKFKTSDWLKVGGAIGFFIFGFFHWLKSDFGGSGTNVFDFFWTGTIPWLLVIATGVITFLLATGAMKAGSLPWPLIFLLATGLAALLLLIRLIFNPIGCPISDCGISRGIGMYLSVISGLVAFAGAFMGFKESGGDFADLKDMNKLKGAFQGSGGSDTAPPPPPPPGMTPPPPPPPPA
jgi:hypothetical protein